jgi:predicted protein tyrosine phosphatase
MEELIKTASQYGAPGLITLGAAWYVIQHDKACNKAHKEMQERHSVERAELIGALERQHKEALEQGAKYIEALNNNTAVMAKLETIITTRTI